MANHASAEKRNRQRIVRTERKRAQRSTVRTVVKQARDALRSGNAKLVPGLVKAAESALARAAQKGVVTAKSSARIASRLASAAAKLAPAPKAAAKR
jgi:small subunit ribosomal protein S20